MAFTITTLTEAIEGYTENSNWSDPSQISVIIQQAEVRINNALEVANFNTRAYTQVDHAATIVAGGSSLAIAGSGPGGGFGDETSPLSPLYFRVRSGAGTEANPWTYLLLKDYNFLKEYSPYDNADNRDQPKYYSFYNDTDNSGLATFSFAPISDGIYDFEILYLFKPASLVQDTNGTWLSTHGTSALLYACLVEAYIFMKGEAELIQVYDLKYKEALQALVAIQGGSFRNSTYRDRALLGAV